MKLAGIGPGKAQAEGGLFRSNGKQRGWESQGVGLVRKASQGEAGWSAKASWTWIVFLLQLQMALRSNQVDLPVS